MTLINSELSGFYRLSMSERRARVAEIAGLSERELDGLSSEGGLSDEQADSMAENVLGVMSLPLGVCVNLRVDERDYLVPMATEEPSVVAAASHASKLLREGGGVHTEVSPPHMIGQIQLLDVEDPSAAADAVATAKRELLRHANEGHPSLVAAGGGAVDLEVHRLPPLEDDDPVGPMLVVHLIVDVRDAMGANAINSMCERIAPTVERLCRGRVGLRILSNLADRRTVKARGSVPFAALEGKGPMSGAELARAIVEASVFAERDPYRAATHNKGIMNGVDSVLIAFGQDWRAVEAGAHAFAARHGRYTALARWRVAEGALVGELELPMAVGTVGGVAGVHPTVKITRRLSHVGDAAELASVTAAVGLAQNLSALRALASEGIQRGHMRLHARNIAVEAGATGADIAAVAERIAASGTVNIDAAKRVLAEQAEQRRKSSLVPAVYRESALLERFEVVRNQHWPSIAALIGEVIDPPDGDAGSLPQMCRYHLDTGGKRLRAILPLMVGEALGQPAPRLEALGAACEMLHNATLVHDDLQDGDLWRRGRMTVWNRFGVPQAINLGDAMFYYTLLLVQRLDASAAVRERLARRVLVDTLRVIDGQEREFALKRPEAPSLDDYYAMVEGKTSGLFALPMAGAAELCGAAPEIVDGLAEAARHMGVLFQIQDDTLDIYGDKGRDSRGSDIAEGKRSALVVHALAVLPSEQAERMQVILDQERGATRPEHIAEALELLDRAGALKFALEQMRLRKQQALGVPALGDHPQLQALVAGMCELFLRPIEPLLAREEP